MTAPIRRRRRSAASAITMRIPSRRWLAGFVLALMLAVAAFTAFPFWQAATQVNGRAGLGDIIGLAQNLEDQPGTLAYKIHHGERVNILLLGYGGAGHDGAYLTDSILMVSIKGPDRVALTSIPRDTWVKIKAFSNGGEYHGKINAPYQIPLSQDPFRTVQHQIDNSYNRTDPLHTHDPGTYLTPNNTGST